MRTEATPLPEPILEVRDLDVYYGPIQATFGVGFCVPDGAIVTLLGANGAGKTTTLRTIAGFIAPRGGTITFRGSNLNRHSPERRVARGMSLVADNRLLFASLSVVENLKAGGYRLRRGELTRRLDSVLSYFPALAERRKASAGSLSGGQAQMLAIGRALMSGPTLLLLDEPSQGLAPRIVADLFALIGRMAADTHMSILLVEQNATLALDIASYGYVLSNGRVAHEAPTADLRQESIIQRIYLGG
jgi:branched-chain amino acid transport system ATP-binding protein